MAYEASKPRQVCVHLGQPFKRWNGEFIPNHLSIDIDGDTVPELIEKLSALQAEHGASLTLRIDIERDRHYDGEFAINVVGWRAETSEEVQVRLEQEKRRQDDAVKYIDEQIERLKRERAKLSNAS
jgi:hypothetical protein